MISKQDLKDYGFKTIEAYFDYIIDSKINGQIQQVENLIKELSSSQKKQFINWLFQYRNMQNINEYFNLTY